MKNIFLAIVIHGIVPLIGYYFSCFEKKIKEERVADPQLQSFLFCLQYGGLQ
jgi:hypothetical protein